MKKRFRKMAAVLLVVVMIFLIIPNNVGAESTLNNKLNQIKSVYPADAYFTVSGNVCYSYQNSDCELKNIPSRGGLPTGAEVANVCGNAWSCCSFAKYVFYCLFGMSPASSSYTSASNLQLGDFIRFYSSNYGEHFGIYLGEDNSNWYVYDSNYTSPATNRIRYYGAISKSGSSIQEARHANNYDEYNKDSFVDLGTDFYAFIMNKSKWMPLTLEANGNVDIKREKPDHCADQIWKFERQNDGSYKIISTANGMVLDLDETSSNVQVWDDWSGNNQRWFIYGDTNQNKYILKPKVLDQVLDLCGNSAEEGTNIQVYPRNGGDAQIFDIYRLDNRSFAANLGNDFFATFLNKKSWITLQNDKEGNVSLQKETKNPRDVWHFKRQYDGSYIICSYYDNKCIDLEEWSHENGANVQVYSENGSDAQRWYFYNNNGDYTVQSKESGKHFDVEDWNFSYGANIQVWDWNGSDAQIFSVFKLESVPQYLAKNMGDSFYALIKSNHDKPIENTGTDIVLGTESKSQNQVWYFELQDDNSYKITSLLDNKVISLQEKVTEDRAKIIVQNSNNDDRQRWYIIENKDGYSFIPKCSQNGSMDLDGNLSADGTKVQYWSFHGWDNQTFKLEFIEDLSTYFNPHQIGDTNLDGIISISDATAIQRHLAELEILTEEQLTLADTNGDGEIDITDATHLQMYLAEYDVILG